jgi:hypothetical protein
MISMRTELALCARPPHLIQRDYRRTESAGRMWSSVSTQGTDNVLTLRYRQDHAPLAGQRGGWAVQKSGSL